MTAPAIRLPACLDTLGAMRLPALVPGAGTLDAAAVETIGFAALQWLAALRARGGGTPAIVAPSQAFVRAAQAGGFAAALLDEPAAAIPGRVLAIRFADAALDFGREPLDALAALGPTLAARPRLRVEAAPDIVACDILVGLDEEAIAAALADFEGAYEIVAGEAPPASEPAPPPPADGILVAGHKLAHLVALADELAAAQAALAHALGPTQAKVAAEIGEVDRLWRILQSAIADVGAAPVADLLGLPAHGWTWQGEPLEIERAVIARVRVPLDATLAAAPGGAVSGVADGSFARLTLTPPPAPDAALVAAVAGTGGAIGGAGDAALALRLPRSLSLVDALVVTVGDGCYALPVAQMVEALRPAPHALQRLGPDEALLRFADGYVPVVSVGAAFGLAGWQADPERAVLVVVETARGRRALLVDTIVDQRQVTVKPIAGIGHVPGTLGAAIVGGNRVALVIDVATLAP